MKILFVHQNFPAQFKHLAPYLASKGIDVTAIAHNVNKQFHLPQIKYYYYQIETSFFGGKHSLLTEEQVKIQRADAVFKLCRRMNKKGYYPDVIMVHPGWGEGLFLRQVWRKARIIGYFEYFYRLTGQDMDFDPQYPSTQRQRLLLPLKNNMNYQAMDAFDAAVTPTKWQRSTYPKWFQKKMVQIHEGINTKVCKPMPSRRIYLSRKHIYLGRKDQVITYVSRYLEPLRGFHIFMNALPEILKKYPAAHVLIVGKDAPGYGGYDGEHISFKHRLLLQLGEKLDRSRVHFLGKLEYDEYLSVLQVSTVHFYASYPFVLSWSLLEAMSCGCTILASKTAPVTELVRHHKNGLLYDFFDQSSLIKSMIKLLDNERLRKRLSGNARKTIKKKYALKKCLKQQYQFIVQQYHNKYN